MNRQVVSAGSDLKNKRLIVEGVVPLDRKVLPSQNAGGMMIYEHRNVGKGGPPRHVHNEQDEWLYVIAGDGFEVEIGEERVTLKAGDSILAPRRIPHGWLHNTDEPGTLLFVVQPAGTMDRFFDSLDGRKNIPSDELAALYEQHDMKLLGPPMEAS